MTLTIQFVELTIYERIFPLVSGYLQTYASVDPTIRSACTFHRYATTVKTPPARILDVLHRSDADVYVFSCYVWNSGLVRSLLPPLLAAHPKAYVLLGGPQVMHQAESYLDPLHENLLLCNGEGERSFRQVLQEILTGHPDLTNVAGLSLFRDGELLTTPPQPRITHLDEIPSPFLGGLFDGGYTMTVFETNRGCPFSCGFCYWGAATNSKVVSFSEDRIRDELAYLSTHGCVFLYIADANWGMFPRDVALSEYIGELSRKHHAPQVVYYSAAKNRPDRMTAITEILNLAGVIATQPVSLQSMNEESLELVQRKNIRLQSYIDLQTRLNEKHISSFTEMIWPLPGETLETLKRGIDTLCRSLADTIVIYPHLLLNNTAIFRERQRHGIVATSVDDGISEVQIVTQTAQVDAGDFQMGMRFFYALHLLHNVRGLFAVSTYLDQHHRMSYGDLYTAFARYCMTQKENDIVAFVDRSLETMNYYDVFNYGKLVHLALHAQRASFDELIRGFVRSMPWWDLEDVRVLFEVDLLNRPYVYSNTPMHLNADLFSYVDVLESVSRQYTVRLPERHLDILRQTIGVEGVVDGSGDTFRVNHRRQQYPYMASESLDHNAGYCHGMVIRIQHMLPGWSSEGTEAALPGGPSRRAAPSI
jgi:tRNA A37 methylthiotransferase MiaB